MQTRLPDSTIDFAMHMSAAHWCISSFQLHKSCLDCPVAQAKASKSINITTAMVVFTSCMLGDGARYSQSQ